MLSRMVGLYFRFLPYTLSLSTGVGMGQGIDRNVDFVRLIGSVCAGVVVGVTYPVSYPLILGNILRKME